MSLSLMNAFKSQIEARPHLQVRLYKAAFLLLTLLTLGACATAMSQQACFWPQSAAGGCDEIAEWTPRG